MQNFSDQAIADGGVKRGLVVTIEKASPDGQTRQQAADGQPGQGR
jgi:hypothetical protein